METDESLLELVWNTLLGAVVIVAALIATPFAMLWLWLTED